MPVGRGSMNASHSCGFCGIVFENYTFAARCEEAHRQGLDRVMVVHLDCDHRPVWFRIWRWLRGGR